MLSQRASSVAVISYSQHLLYVCSLSDKLEVQTQKSHRISKDYEGAVCLQDAGMQTLDVTTLQFQHSFTLVPSLYTPLCTRCSGTLHSSVLVGAMRQAPMSVLVCDVGIATIMFKLYCLAQM